MRTTTNRIIIILLGVITFALFSGCGSKQKTVQGGNTTLEAKTQNKLLDDVLAKGLKYETLSAKGSIEIRTKKGESGNKFTTVYKIVKGQGMQASVRVPLRGEVARVDFTLDSIIVLDRWRGRYVAENYKNSALTKNIDFNYYNLQALLTNELFIPGADKVTKKDYSKYSVLSYSGLYMMNTSGEPDLSYSFAVDALDKIVSVMINNRQEPFSLQWTYSNFVEKNNQVYPTTISASTVVKGKTFEIIVSYSDMEIDKKDTKINSSIPKKYDKVTFEEFLSSYIKL